MTICRITTSIAGIEHIGIERGHHAIAALRHIGGHGLQVIKSRVTFQPIHEHEVVPVFPCSTCKDGGLRVVGRFRSQKGWQRVHACDTCGAVQQFPLAHGV